MPTELCTPIDEVSDRYIAALGHLDPYVAVRDGFETASSAYTDYSSSGVAARIDLANSTLRNLNQLEVSSRTERIAVRFLREFVEGESALWQQDRTAPMLRLIGGPIADVVSVARSVLTCDVVDWSEVVERLAYIPRALESIEMNLRETISRGVTSTRSEAGTFSNYCIDLGGVQGQGFLDSLLPESGVPAAYRRSFEKVSSATHIAFLKLGHFVRDQYIEKSLPEVGIGHDRYLAQMRFYVGGESDPNEIYARAWSRFRSTLTRLQLLVQASGSYSEIGEMIWRLESNQDLLVNSYEELCAWMQGEISQSVDSLSRMCLPEIEDAKSFTVRRSRGWSRSALQVSAPKEGRPAIVWARQSGEIQIPRWRYRTLLHAVTIPGHLYNWSYCLGSAPHLNSAQRLLYRRFTYAGWGHYSTQLMNEFELFESVPAQVSFLQRELLQSARLLVDVGLNLGMKVPNDSKVCPGEPWSFSVGTQFIAQSTYISRQAATDEMSRVVASSGQFPAYRVQSDAIRAGRTGMSSKLGSEFDLLKFHTELLDLGPLGVNDLEDELGRLPMGDET